MSPHRAGIVAILGRPNVGKSTLLNRILGEKLAAVSPRPQTTRERILGVLTRADVQVAFVDTPGIHLARGRLNRFMVDEALTAVNDTDAVLLLVEAPKEDAEALATRGTVDLGESNRLVLQRAREAAKPVILTINKIDRLRDKTALLPFLTAWERKGPFAAMVPVSAATGDGVERLIAELVALLPEAPPLYPPETLTDRTERFLAAELIREQVFLKTRQEIPYGVAVVIERFEERPEDEHPERRRDVMIEAILYVERDSQKGILVGKGGRMVKEIGTQARLAIAELCGCPAHLRLTVTVEPDWSEDPEALRRFGYVPGGVDLRGAG